MTAPEVDRFGARGEGDDRPRLVDAQEEVGDGNEQSAATPRTSVAVDNTPAQAQPWESGPGDLMAPNDWYGLFNFTDDYTAVLGSSGSPLDSLNLQNLEFLYRFL